MSPRRRVSSRLGRADLTLTSAEFYKKLTTPSSNWVNELRPLVLSKKLPRKVFVQPVTSVSNGEVVLKEYPVTLEGVIESFVERAL